MLPALLASALLALALWRAAREAGASGWLVLVVVAANPFAMRAYDIGHPEEVVGAVLCVGAMLAAVRGRPAVAGVLVGLAVASKPWAVVAVLPVLLARDARRVRCALLAAAACVAVLGPLLIWGTAAHTVGDAARNDTTIFQPWQLFWFFGKHTGPIQRIIGERVGYRASVPWAQAVSHPAVVLVAVGLALAWWPRRRPADALALLALVGLTRCLLDTWNTDYYGVPFLFALAAHEVVGRGRAPRATLVVTLAFWVTIELLPGPDAQTAGYLAVAGTTWVCLALTTYAPARAARLARRARCAAARALPTLLGQPTSSATAAPSSPALTA